MLTVTTQHERVYSHTQAAVCYKADTIANSVLQIAQDAAHAQNNPQPRITPT